MEAILLQDWITINLADGVGAVAQSAHQYVDIGQHEDLVFYLTVKSFSGTGLTISYQTAPSPQDSLFLSMVAPVTVAAGLRVDTALFSTAAVPPARYIRWSLQTVSGPGNATFRIWVAAYAYA